MTNPNYIHITTRDNVLVAIPTHKWTLQWAMECGGMKNLFSTFTVAEILRNVPGSFIPRN